VTAPELYRPIRLDTIGGASQTIAISAEPNERAALAKRFGLLALDRLEAEVGVERDGAVILARGRLRAEVVQACIASDEPVPAKIDEAFALRFVPENALAEGDEIELNEIDCDTLPHDGKVIELGEAVAETLALALDPFPRSPGAEAALREAGVVAEEEAKAASSPFAKLLKR
jgi:uncharacterized metal-binding protein YceD (DUF177 family)